MIQEQYLPPQALVSALPQIWPKAKRVAAGISIVKTCFNNIGSDPMRMSGMSPEGRSFLLKTLGLWYYEMHPFFRAWINQRPQDSVGIMIKDTMMPIPKPNLTLMQVMHRNIKDIGAHEIWREPFTDSDLHAMLESFSTWLTKKEPLHACTSMFQQSWGAMVLAKDTQIYMFSLANKAFSVSDMSDPMTIDLVDIDETAPTSITCDGCDAPRPCAIKQNNGQTLCRSCTDAMSGSYIQPGVMPSCCHFECKFAGCPMSQSIDTLYPRKIAKNGSF